MPQVLIETRMNSLKLNESKAPKKGCLGRLEGVCADFKNPTRNGRLYPLELWQKVFNDPLFKEALANKTLFGELDHPEERFEPLVKHACIVMTDYTIDEDKGLIYGGFDILDTPDGRVLRNILDYGSVLGVSSRGQGDIIECADGERVDEDSYDFACFDVVSTPAVEKARQKVVESMKREKKETFKESIERQIGDADTAADLNIIRSVVKTSDLTSSEMNSILESIEDKCKSLSGADETIIAENVSDEKNVTDTKRIDESIKPAKTIRGNARLYKCISNMREQISAYKHREARYVECIDNHVNEIHDKECEIDSLKDQLTKCKASIKSLKTESANKSKSFDRRISTLKESMHESSKATQDAKKKFESETAQLERKLEQTTTKLTESSNKIKSLVSEKSELQKENMSLDAKNQKINSELSEKKSKIVELSEQIQSYRAEIEKLNSDLKESRREHASEISSIDGEVSEYSQLLSEAQEKISSGNSTIESLKESLRDTQDSLKREKATLSALSENLAKYQKSYIDRVSKLSGIDPDSIYHTISDKTTPKQIDSIVESYRKKLDRYNKLGISEKGIDTDSKYVVESLNTSYDPYEANEQDNLISFLTTASNSL